MKKAISFSLVLGMIFLPCLGVSAQKRSRVTVDGGEGTKRQIRPAKQTSNEFESITALSSGQGAMVRWTMRSEKANIGFYVHRVDPNSESLANEEIVFGSAAKTGRYPLFGEQYTFFDPKGGLDSAYFIETLDLDGNRTVSRSVTTRYSEIAGSVNELQPDTEKDRRGAIEEQQLKLSREIARETEAVSSDPDPEKHKWVISHPGARIDVKTEGIYRVPFAQLASAGFDIESDQTLWQLYKNGVEQAIRIDDAGSYIEFFGKGIDTAESEVQGYFLIIADTAGKRIVTVPERPPTSSIPLSSYRQASIYKERNIYLDTILNGPAENYWGRGIPLAGTNVQFDLTNIDFNSPNSILELKVQGFSSGIHNVQVTLNGQLLMPLNGVSQFAYSAAQTIPTSILRDSALGQGPNTLNLASVGPTGDFNLFDSVKVTFDRKHAAIQNTLKAYTARNKKTQIGGFSSANVRMYDITFENEPRLMTDIAFQDQGGSFGAELNGLRPRVFFAAEESKILAPFAVNRNDGEVLGDPGLGADLVVITYKDLRVNADAWALYRSNQGFQTKVVDVDEIFNEFNYGNSSSDSIEAFLNYTYNNWATRPGYVLLIGDASRDPRNYSNSGYFNLVPTRMVTTVFTETGSDDSLVDFDNDGLAEMAIGRVPSRLPSDVENVFQKTQNWETDLGPDPMSRGSLFAVDEFDVANNLDFRAISDRVMGELPATVPKTVVERNQADAPNMLRNSINEGRYSVNFTGHGSAGLWTKAYAPNVFFFWSGTATTLTNNDKESLFTMLTCLNGYFLFPIGEGLAETLMSHTNGGAVVTWASTGLTTPDVQEVMARRFYRKIGEGEIPRIGDLIRDAKSVIVGGTDVRQSWALLGDPMLKVR